MTFFFYDLETSGLSPAYSRIMQFAGQRTDMDLKPVGEPINLLIKLTEDILPEPESVLIHGITPQKTVADGITEPELLKLLESEVFTPETIVVGFNNIRFDDEFLRYNHWRNFYDPYEWAYKDGRSRWDLLDVMRLTHALRPEGLRWPNIDGKPSHRLEAMAHANKIDVGTAHDALSDVNTTIGLARLVKSAQPKLFDWLLKLRDKNEVAKIVLSSPAKPFIYASGRYPSDVLHTTAVVAIGKLPADDNGVLVYDLRQSPEQYLKLSDDQLTEVLFGARDSSTLPRPVKKLALNRSPAIAPLATLDDGAQRRLKLSHGRVMKHAKLLNEHKDLSKRLVSIFLAREPYPKAPDPEGQLYEGGFLGPKDKAVARELRKKSQADLMDWQPDFIDERLSQLYLRYKARNYPQALTDHEQTEWESWRTNKLVNGSGGSLSLQQFTERLQLLVSKPGLSENNSYLLEELQLWAESIAPLQIFS